MSAPESDDVYASAEARVGLVLNDKWTLEKLLGVGAMGAVYAGKHRNGARGAIKLLHMTLAREPQLRERFLREGYAANRVEHPGAVKVLDDDTVTSGPCEGSAYLVMELLIGESLQDRILREEPVGEREFLLVASAVLATLEKAHANGVVHRDLKPENIFLLAEDAIPSDESLGSIRIPGRPRVKVLDFGLARLLDAVSTTHHGMALGTPSYMSPEQASGNNADLDGRTDLFSLAATGFRLVAGRRVHEGAQHVLIQVTNMATLPAPRVKSVAPHVTYPFARVIDRALQFKREDRFADAAEMRTDVEKALIEIEEIARNPTLADIPEVPEVPPAPSAQPSSASSVKVPSAPVPPPASSIKVAAAPPLPPASSKKLPVAENISAEKATEPAAQEAIATALENEPDHESIAPPKASRALLWMVLLALIAASGIAAWALTHDSQESLPAPASSASALASSDVLDAGASAMTAPTTSALPSAETLLDAGDAGDAAPDDDDVDAGEITIELDASLDNTLTITPATSAPKPRPKPKPVHPAGKPSAKPPPKKPPTKHWF